MGWLFFGMAICFLVMLGGILLQPPKIEIEDIPDDIVNYTIDNLQPISHSEFIRKMTS